MKIEDLKQEYATQDNRATAYPIYVTVQELVCIGVIAEGCSVNCPYGDGEIKLEHNCDTCEKYPCWENDDCQDEPDHCSEDDDCQDEPDHCSEDVRCGYIWHPVEFFLTINGAEEYMKANAHNHGKLRTYVHCFERRNFEMRNLLIDMGFKTNDN